ncbi:MAG: chemotaxis protein CheB [Bacteroidetes bacterium]|nr:MAG: chemotaxis protein CheB [Bacteroidota bacterium]
MIESNIHIEPFKGKLIAIGGSAGSFNPLLALLEAIPSASQHSWVVLLHRNSQKKSNLISLLQHHCKLKVKEAEDKEPLEPGVVYVAPSAYHLLLESNFSWQLDAGEPLWHCKPAIDVLFDSVADAAGKEACGILLSGANQDGAQGLRRMKLKGGLCLVQDPKDAMYPSMPSAATKLKAQHQLFSEAQSGQLIKQLMGQDK